MPSFEKPPEHLTWYHVPTLLEAEELGRIEYRWKDYRNHGVSNNAVVCIWQGLLVDSGDGVILTDLGRQKLQEWKATPEGQRLARINAENEAADA